MVYNTGRPIDLPVFSCEFRGLLLREMVLYDVNVKQLVFKN